MDDRTVKTALEKTIKEQKIDQQTGLPSWILSGVIYQKIYNETKDVKGFKGRSSNGRK